MSSPSVGMLPDLPVVVFTLAMAPDESVTLRSINEVVRELFAAEPAELVADVDRVLASIHPGEVGALLSSLRTSSRALTRWEWRGRGFAADGTLVYLRGLGTPRQEADGTTVWDGVLLDETEVAWSRELEAAMRRRLQHIVERLPASSVALFDRGQRLCFCEGQLFSGIDIGSRLGRPLSEFAEDPAFARIGPGLDAMLAGEPAPPVVLEADHAGRALSINFAPYRLPDGRLDGALVHWQDISDLRASERARREAEERFRRAFEDAAIGMALVDLDGRWLRVNRALCRTLGRRPDELVGTRVHDTTHPDDVDETARVVASLRDGSAASYTIEKRHLRRDGHTVWVRLAVSVVNDEAGRPRHFVSQIEDISERKRSEQELALARAQIDRFFAMSRDLMAITDGDGRFVRVNPAFSRTLGYSEAELLSRPAIEFVHPEDVAATLHTLARQRQGEEAVEFGNRYRSADGSHRWLLWNATALEDGYIYAAGRDITERREMEHRLRESREQALAASRLKSEFVANMSHEIRTPLNGVVSMTELLLGSALDAEQRQYTEVTMASAHALTHVIDDILDFSKIEAGKLELVEDDFSVAEAVAEVCGILAGPAGEKQLALLHTVEPTVPALVRGDAGRLRQVLLNLVGNAVKFTSAGEVVVHVGVEGASPARLRVEVRDTGIGIAAQHLQRLFAPFAQADATTTRRYGGTGLGLSIAKQLTELMGGEIGVRSTPGVGSTFWLRLPCRSPADAHAPAAAPVMPPVAAPAASRGRVLIAEDNQINQFVASTLLTKLGYAVDVAGDGREAVRRAAGTPYAAVFMDCQMPELDGYQATAAIRAVEPAGRHTPIVAMTASTMAGDRERCLDAGMDAYLAKPLRLEALAEVCGQLLVPEPAAASKAPAFDVAALDAVAAGAQARELLGLFLDQLQRSTGELSELAAAGDVDGVHRVAHRLTGSAAVVGAREVSEVCQEICANTRGEHDPGLAHWPAALSAAAQACTHAITAHLRA